MRIDLAGFGPGGADLATRQVWAAIGEADLIITSERLAGILRKMKQSGSGRDGDSLGPGGKVLCDEDRLCDLSKARIMVGTEPEKILRILGNEPFERAVCLFGGDCSFYSGAAPLSRLFEQSGALRARGAEIRFLPGISSLSAACARLGISFRELEVFSAHGRACDPVKSVMSGKRCFFLTGGKRDPARLCAELTRCGLGDMKVTICERLFSPGERISRLTAREASGQEYDSLSVLLTEPAFISGELRRSVPGIPDESFIRGSVPMTKRLVRVSAMSLINPSENDLVWDLGAGTGSVSIELSAHCGKVVSVEKNPEAVSLMEENRKKFGAWNMEIVRGEIPGILGSLPAPDKIFVGGGGRWIREILKAIKERFSGRTLPAVCASAVTLETLEEVRNALEAYEYETEIVQVAVTGVKKRGDVHMLDAQNPVFLIAGMNLGGA